MTPWSMPAGPTVLVIGDVMGHDIRAAATMGQVRAVLRTCAVQGGQMPSQVLTATEDALERLGLDVLASATVVRIDQSPVEAERGLRRMTWSSAGHPPPILLLPSPRPATTQDGTDASTGAGDRTGPTGGARAQVLRHGGDCDPGPAAHEGVARARLGGLVDLRESAGSDVLLGIGVGTVRVDHSCEVPAGATLLLYTDGLVERRGADLDIGTAALCRVLEAEAARELEDLLDEGLRQLVGDGHADDVAVLAVRAHSEQGPRPAEAGPARAAGPADTSRLPPAPDSAVSRGR